MIPGLFFSIVLTLVVLAGFATVVFLLLRRGPGPGADRDALIQANERLLARDERIAQLGASIAIREQELAAAREASNQIRAELAAREAQLAEERKAAAEKLAVLEDARVRLSDAFKALSSEALKSNNESFLNLAKSTLEKFQETAKGDLEKRQLAIDQLVKPVTDTLGKFDARLLDMEKARVGAYEGLQQQVKSMLETQTQLRDQAANLVSALGTPRVRGRWGEIQLRRVVELAGMLDHCDFYEQQNAITEDGRLRPDLIVKLPGGKNIVVDAKAPLAGYLEAIEAQDDATRALKLDAHARHIREHMQALSRKSYWEQFQPAPEFVVLFLPGETFFSAALERDPSLIEQGVDQRVILATPTTLITLLKAVSYGWRQEALAANAQQISVLGQELHKRILDMTNHFTDVGSRLGKAVESYNKAIGSLETRVLVSARKFSELETTGTHDDLPSIDPIESTPRLPRGASNGSEPSLPGV
jgi:DNA recombination protein RmuC